MNASHSLGQLIQSVEDSKGWTLREIARRVERTGRTMSHAYVARLKREPIKSVTYDTIHALSVGLDVPERIVAAAALESMGVHDIGTAETGAAVAIARDPDLSERDRRILLAVVREMHGEHEDRGVQVAHHEGSGKSHALEDSAAPHGVSARADDTNLARSDADGRPLVAEDLAPAKNPKRSELPEFIVAEELEQAGAPGERGRPLTREDLDRAADDSGPSELDRLDREARARGEESQDHEDWIGEGRDV